MNSCKTWLAVSLVGMFMVVPAMAINVAWTGSGSSGADPLGHGWTLSNNGPEGNAVVGIPGNGLGTDPWLGGAGDFVTDFHFQTDDANIVATATGSSSGLTTMWHVDSDVGGSVWDRQLMGTNEVWFVSPAGLQLDSGEDFFWNVVLDSPLNTINFTAEWTMGPELILGDLDIKPGSDPNSVNLKSRGVLPVAILTTGDFDALEVDVTSIVFGDPVLLNDGGMGVAPLRSGEEDVNDDGFTDLTLKFSMSDLVAYGALGDMSMEAILTGLTTGGMMFEGMDSLRIVPPGDANGDGLVNAVDYAIWSDGLGGPNPELSTGDFNGDGSTDGVDYAIWTDNFAMNLSAPGSAVAAVPEPSTFVLICCGLFGLTLYGWRRRREA